MRGNFDMSSAGKPKEKSDATRNFHIGFEEGAGPIPGVTQLLNPQLMEDRANAAKARPQSAASVAAAPLETPKEITIDLGEDYSKPLEAVTSPNIIQRPVGKSLADFKVQYELHFESERGAYRFTRMRGHTRESFALWQQKFFFQMKLDLQALGVKNLFQEYTKNTDTFQADAFGLDDASHVQIVRIEGSPQKIFVLLSNQSLVKDEAVVRDLLLGKGVSPAGDGSGDDDEGDFKIELAS
jgi:hypothetical protein